MTAVRIQQEAFDVGAELRALRQTADGKWDTRVGAVATFVGTVRDMNEGDTVKTLVLEHYPGMTESSIQEIIDQAMGRWPLFPPPSDIWRRTLPALCQAACGGTGAFCHHQRAGGNARRSGGECAGRCHRHRHGRGNLADPAAPHRANV